MSTRIQNITCIEKGDTSQKNVTVNLKIETYKYSYGDIWQTSIRAECTLSGILSDDLIVTCDKKEDCCGIIQAGLTSFVGGNVYYDAQTMLAPGNYGGAHVDPTLTATYQGRQVASVKVTGGIFTWNSNTTSATIQDKGKFKNIGSVFFAGECYFCKNAIADFNRKIGLKVWFEKTGEGDEEIDTYTTEHYITGRLYCSLLTNHYLPDNCGASFKCGLGGAFGIRKNQGQYEYFAGFYYGGGWKKTSYGSSVVVNREESTYSYNTVYDMMKYIKDNLYDVKVEPTGNTDECFCSKDNTELIGNDLYVYIEIRRILVN